MSGLIRVLVLIAGVMLCSVSVAAQPLRQQTSDRNAVTVKALPTKLVGDVWEFEIVMETHSQDLKDDLLKIASLVAADGTSVLPTGWKGNAPDGHHRKGTLRFNALKPRPDTLELRILRIGEPGPRVFKWPMP